MSQLFTDDEIIADTPKQKRFLQVLRWVIKLLVTILTTITTCAGINSCGLFENGMEPTAPSEISISMDSTSVILSNPVASIGAGNAK